MVPPALETHAMKVQSLSDGSELLRVIVLALKSTIVALKFLARLDSATPYMQLALRHSIESTWICPR